MRAALHDCLWIAHVILVSCHVCQCGRVLKINSIGPCTNTHEVTKVINVTILHDQTKYYATYTNMVEIPAKAISMVAAKLFRNTGGRKRKQVANIRYSNFCAKLEDTAAIWWSWFKGYDPPFKCPIKRGAYTNTNATLSSAYVDSPVVPLPYEESTWDVRMTFLNEDKQSFLCMDMTTSVGSI